MLWNTIRMKRTPNIHTILKHAHNNHAHSNQLVGDSKRPETTKMTQKLFVFKTMSHTSKESHPSLR